MLEGISYKVGDRVDVGGMYVCVPCGYTKKFTKGDTFPRCLGCMKENVVTDEENFVQAARAGEEVDEFDENTVVANLEVWELLREE